MKFNTRPTNLILLKTLFFFGLGIKRVFAIIIKNISRHDINYAIDLFFFIKLSGFIDYFSTLVSLNLKVSKISRNNRIFDFCMNIWITNFYFITRRVCREIYRFRKIDVSSLSAFFPPVSSFETRPWKTSKTKLRGGNSIRLARRRMSWRQFRADSEFTASGFVFLLSCETVQPIRASRLHENLVAEKTLSLRLIRYYRFSFHSES